MVDRQGGHNGIEDVSGLFSGRSKLRFEQDGFLRVENHFSGRKLLELERELNQYHETIVPGLPAGQSLLRCA